MFPDAHGMKFNKPNKQNVSETNLFIKFNFYQSQNNCRHTDWCQEWNIKTSLLKISYITLLSDAPSSDANVPVRFRDSSEQSTANHSSRPTVLQLKCVSDTISNWFENRQPQKTKISTATNGEYRHFLSFKQELKKYARKSCGCGQHWKSFDSSFEWKES